MKWTPQNTIARQGVARGELAELVAVAAEVGEEPDNLVLLIVVPQNQQLFAQPRLDRADAFPQGGRCKAPIQLVGKRTQGRVSVRALRERARRGS